MPVCPAGRSERRQKKRAGNCPFQSGRGPSRWSAGLGGKNFSLSIKRSGRVVKRITDEVRQHAFADHSCNYTTRLAFLPASKPHIALTPFSSPPPPPFLIPSQRRRQCLLRRLRPPFPRVLSWCRSANSSVTSGASARAGFSRAQHP